MIYFDNAATTPVLKEVAEAVLPYYDNFYGNPSSTHGVGRQVKIIIEEARRYIAQLFGVSNGEIFFTSGGTESINTILNGCVNDLGCKHIITSPIEHHATLHCIEYLEKRYNVKVSFVNILPNGDVDLNHLEHLLKQNIDKTLVSLLHANNEIGNIIDAEKVCSLSKRYNAFIHLDTVQSVGHYHLNLKQMGVDFICASGHKFHAPKGVGFFYMSSNAMIHPFLRGGVARKKYACRNRKCYRYCWDV